MFKSRLNAENVSDSSCAAPLAHAQIVFKSPLGLSAFFNYDSALLVSDSL